QVQRLQTDGSTGKHPRLPWLQRGSMQKQVLDLPLHRLTMFVMGSVQIYLPHPRTITMLSRWSVKNFVSLQSLQFQRCTECSKYRIAGRSVTWRSAGKNTDLHLPNPGITTPGCHPRPAITCWQQTG